MSRPQHNRFGYGFTLLIGFTLIASGCNSCEPGGDTDAGSTIADQGDSGTLVPPDAGTPVEDGGGHDGGGASTCTPYDFSSVSATVELDPQPAYDGNAPLLIYNYRHTEDPFNLEVATEMQDAMVVLMKNLQMQYPQLHPVWTLQFQGSDANALGESTIPIIMQSVAGLQQGAEDGFLRFGYHGQHDPTYVNRPHQFLSEDSTWPEIVEALLEYISCKKNVSFSGDCDPDPQNTGGGIQAILTHFGHVDIVSGLQVPTDASVQFETGAGSHAIKKLLPDRHLGFGFSDHAPGGANYLDIVTELMERMTVGGSADGALLWWDNALRIHDTDALLFEDEVGGLKYRDPMNTFVSRWEQINRDRPHVLLAHLGGKYSYVCEGSQSPTIYGYAEMVLAEAENREAQPQLPQLAHCDDADNGIRPLADRQQNYDNSAASLEFVAQQLQLVPGSRFVDTASLMERVAPADYWSLSESEITAMARWLLQEWTSDGAPPDFVTDGIEYYSLRDGLGALLGAQLAPGEEHSLDVLYGPLTGNESETEGCLPTEELTALAQPIWDQIVASRDADWVMTPQNILPDQVSSSIGLLNLAQVLRALATMHIAQVERLEGNGVQIQPALGTPETAALIEQLGTYHEVETSWSLKPARVRVE